MMSINRVRLGKYRKSTGSAVLALHALGFARPSSDDEQSTWLATWIRDLVSQCNLDDGPFGPGEPQMFAHDDAK